MAEQMGRHRPYQTKPVTILGIDDGPRLEGNWWLVDGEPFGMHLHHPYDEMAAGTWPGCAGGGYIAWTVPENIGPLVARHQLVSGGPDDLDHFEIAPSLWHRGRGEANSPHHGCHGFIRGGRWALA